MNSQHRHFAFHALPNRLAQLHPDEWVDYLSGSFLTYELGHLWEEWAEDEVHPEHVMPHPDARSIDLAPGQDGVLITLPQPVRPGDCKYVLVVTSGEPAYLALEMETERRWTVWSVDGEERRKLSSPPSPDVEFLVGPILDRSAEEV